MKTAVVGSINMDMTVTAERIPLKGETLKERTSATYPEERAPTRPLPWQSWEQMWRCSAVWAVMRREEAS